MDKLSVSNFNPGLSIPDFLILLWLTSDDFTHRRYISCTQKAKHFNLTKLSPTALLGVGGITRACAFHLGDEC